MPIAKLAGPSKRVSAKPSRSSTGKMKGKPRRKPLAKKSKSTSKPAAVSTTSDKQTRSTAATTKYLDPWIQCKSQYGGRLSPAEEFNKLQNHSFITAVLPRDFPTNGLELSASLIADNAFDAIQATHCGLRSANFTVDVTLSTLLVAVDLSRNDITSIRLDSTCFIRKLNLSHNALAAFPKPLPHSLLYLDLSFNTIKSVPEKLHEEVEQLRHLNLNRNAVTSIAPLAPCSFLEQLSLGDNQLDFSNDQQITPLYSLKRLKTLRIIGNLATEGVEPKLRKRLPCLLEMNDVAVTVAFGDVHDLVQDTVERSIGASQLQDSASCSCVYGNPCAEKYNCRDWENRFLIARNAREEKYDNVF